MKQIFAFTISFFFSLMAFAQTKGRVTGTVQDGSPKAVASATISLIRLRDSAIVKVAAADKTGNFSFDELQNGTYLVRVSLVGHKTCQSESFEISSNNTSISLKTIILSEQDKMMNAVIVTGKRPLIEQKLDRTIVNVDASPTNVGSSAMEVLEKSPGISVDKDGNISLKGKAGVVVFVDGRPTQLGGSDLANLLKNMTASQLDQIEIMTNPPAKYDAAGNAGVINIRTKKNKQLGYNGTLNLGYGQGRFPKFNESGVFNYRENKVNLFTNLSHNYRRSFNELHLQRRFRDANSKEVTSSFDQVALMNRESNSYNGKLGMDYFANDKTTFGVVLGGFSSPTVNTNDNSNLIYNNLGVRTGKTISSSVLDEQWKNFSTNINFRRILDTTGSEISADLDYVTYRNTSKQQLSNSYYDANFQERQKADTLFGQLPQKINIYSGKVDYLLPLKNGAKVEAGVKSSLVQTVNNAIYDTVHYSQRMLDSSRTNGFDYKEIINAAYVNWSGNLSPKFSLQLGLRLENTISTGRSTGYVYRPAGNEFVNFDSSFERNYTQLFPTVYFQYKPNDKNSFVVNYGRRIRRPNYESLNPFIKYIDRYTYQQGNPDLKPQFSHNIELSHSYKGILTTTLNYTRTTDIIQQVIQQNEAKNETYVKQANIARQEQIGVSISANFPITKWWTSNVYVNVYNNKNEGLIDQNQLSASATTLALNGSQQFKLSSSLSGELSGWFRTASVEGVLSTRPMGGLSIGFSQQVMKGKGTIRLNVRDVLYTQQFRASSRYGTVDAAFQEKSDSRVVNLGFSFRFSKGKVNTPKKRNSGSSGDEQNRVNAGN